MSTRKLLTLILSLSIISLLLIPAHAFATDQPDLTIVSAAITSRTASQTTYTCTILNNGTTTISNLYSVSIQNFYSSNTIFYDTGDVPAGGRILGINMSLAPGESYTFTFYASGAAPSGMNYLTFKIDWGNIVDESNENNNTYALYLEPQDPQDSQPDLVITSATITSRTATQIGYTYTIKNNGDATIPNLYNVSIQNFYSDNTIFYDTGDIAAGGRILGITSSLAPGETYTGTFYAYGAVPSGMSYLTFKIDWGDIVTESNENNNTYALLL